MAQSKEAGDARILASARYYWPIMVEKKNWTQKPFKKKQPRRVEPAIPMNMEVKGS